MSKLTYEEIEEVISSAWDKAIEHLEQNLGEQYKNWESGEAYPKFVDKVMQDVTFADEEDWEECRRCEKKYERLRKL